MRIVFTSSLSFRNWKRIGFYSLNSISPHVVRFLWFVCSFVFPLSFRHAIKQGNVVIKRTRFHATLWFSEEKKQANDWDVVLSLSNQACLLNAFARQFPLGDSAAAGHYARAKLLFFTGRQNRPLWRMITALKCVVQCVSYTPFLPTYYIQTGRVSQTLIPLQWPHRDGHSIVTRSKSEHCEKK